MPNVSFCDNIDSALQPLSCFSLYCFSPGHLTVKGTAADLIHLNRAVMWFPCTVRGQGTIVQWKTVKRPHTISTPLYFQHQWWSQRLEHSDHEIMEYPMAICHHFISWKYPFKSVFTCPYKWFIGRLFYFLLKRQFILIGENQRHFPFRNVVSTFVWRIWSW